MIGNKEHDWATFSSGTAHMRPSHSESIDIADARAIVHDLFKPNLWIYWGDFLISLTIAYGCAIAYFNASLFSPQQIICFVVSGFALHRVTNYIHEVSHLRSKRALRSFRIGWDILAGIPTLMPSFFFDTHMAHHNTGHYGTRTDCEYVPLGNGPYRKIALFLGQLFLQPLFVIVRFVLVTPISFLHPKLRQWVLENYSSFVFVFPCPRTIPENAPRAAWAAIDIACCLRATAMFVSPALGFTPWHRIPQIYFLALIPLSLHYFRSLTAHNYLSDGKKQTFHDQIMDSIDITGVPILTELLYPIGLRYHALHHLFPSMPYHNLATAHRRLMAELPADSPYRSVVYPSVWSVLRELIHNSRAEAERSREEPTSQAA